ncbi:uncharacterized protein LOC106660946 [Cimex lectularius]|uniref:CPR type cuticle protein n=1 Tax=Cimex lectularius TaxID=79782 RepID=A0A8I6R6T7_CIMLE|nr:uncharacterized protein LOC106660946 [Cimex lectularius]
MANVLRIGLLLATLSLITIWVQPSDADEVKKKRVIIKVPTRIKHVYHHHTKKIHIHKKKPKTKPHSIHVVHVEDEIDVHPKESWKSITWKAKGGKSKKMKNTKWNSHQSFEWKTPKGFSSSEESGESLAGEASRIKEDYSLGSGEEGYGRWYDDVEYSKKKGSKPRKVRAKSKGIINHYDYDESLYEDSYIDEDFRRPHKKPTRKAKYNKYKERMHKKLHKRPKYEEIYISEDYDDGYGKGVWPERKEHPSWHQKTKKEWVPSAPAVSEEPEEMQAMHQQNYMPYQTNYYDGSLKGTEWIGLPAPSTKLFVKPVVVPSVKQATGPPAGSGYHSKVSQGDDGLSVGYQSHVGHSNDFNQPSSSFQSVTFGDMPKHR